MRYSELSEKISLDAIRLKALLLEAGIEFKGKDTEIPDEIAELIISGAEPKKLKPQQPTPTPTPDKPSQGGMTMNTIDGLVFNQLCQDKAILGIQTGRKLAENTLVGIEAGYAEAMRDYAGFHREQAISSLGVVNETDPLSMLARLSMASAAASAGLLEPAESPTVMAFLKPVQF